MTSSSPSNPTPREPIWVVLVLLIAAGGMAFLLWFSPNTHNPSQPKTQASQRRQASLNNAKARIRILPPRYIPLRAPAQPDTRNNPANSSPRQAPSLRPTSRPTLRYNSALMFYPIPVPLHLQKRVDFYKQRFGDAAKLAHQVHERLFLTQLHKERMLEAKTKTIREGFLRLTTMRYMRYRGHKRYRQLGFAQLLAFETLLAQYLAKGGPVDRIPRKRKELASIAAQLSQYGGFYPLLLRNVGLKSDAQKLDKSQQFWLRTLFMSRWIRTGIGYYPLPILMGTTLYVDYNKARFLFSRNEKKRIYYLHELKRLEPTIPHLRMLGWLWAQLHKPKLARLALRDALKQDPTDTIARRLLDKLPKSPS